VDLDGDGINDVLSGSWPGELYCFKGRGKGQYAAAVKLKGKGGKEINAGQASTVFAADWRGTGRLDLLVGCIEGYVWLVPNDGTKGKPAFGEPVKLRAGGKEIQVAHGDSHPVVADWEGTGNPGLVVGCGDGSVVWFRNDGSRKAPKLAAAMTLVRAPGWDHTKKPDGPIRGSRAKVWVGDWDGDGRLDLLLGDFSHHEGEGPKLSAADRKRKAVVEREIAGVQKRLKPYFDEIDKIYARKADRKEIREKAMKVAAKYKTDLEEQRKLYRELARFRAPTVMHGYVWLHLRKPAERAAAE
jgi:FG-GAP-like repeat